MKKAISFIGAAYGKGAGDKRTEDAPEALKNGRLHDFLKKSGIHSAWEGIFPESGDKFFMHHEKAVREAIHRQKIPVVIGGDHSCAIGTWRAVSQCLNGSFGLIWIDAHMDSHTPETTPSGNIHGMPLAALLGFGTHAMTGGKSWLKPGNLCLIGARSFEKEEAELLQNLGVRIFFMAEIQKRGLDAVFQEALSIAKKETTGFGISIDIDAFDPLEGIGTGTPVPGGIKNREMLGALSGIGCDPDFSALELVEYNPAKDKKGITQKLIFSLLASFFTEPGK